MYTNDLLEEKYKAQRQLSERAGIEKTNYFEIAKQEVENLYKKNGWKMSFAKRSGGHIGAVAK
ncbi:MAG: hypothetical protein ACUZ8E_02970 [Candidatus Anammoxibacter sp.]